MLRLLGFVFLVLICIGIAPWALVAGTVIYVGWVLVSPTTNSRRPSSSNQLLRITGAGTSLSAIPLVNAVYCVNCDSITNSPHDSCAVCASRSVIAVSRMWQLTVLESQPKTARYRVSFSADVRDIPADGLNESTKLIGRLAELGGNIQALHIQVDPVSTTEAVPINGRLEVVRHPPRAASMAVGQLSRQAS